jgi:hypothetical protein
MKLRHTPEPNQSDSASVLSIHVKPQTIKLEVEKLLKAGFIYPVALTEWVSEPRTDR